MLIEVDRELFNDVEQFERLEITRRRLTIRSTLAAKLVIEIVEEIECRTNVAAIDVRNRR